MSNYRWDLHSMSVIQQLWDYCLYMYQMDSSGGVFIHLLGCRVFCAFITFPGETLQREVFCFTFPFL